jgi:hypothetical protein
MEVTWSDFVVNFDELDDIDLIGDWQWLLEEDMKPVLVTSLGDMFLMTEDQRVFWLAIGEGTIEQVAGSETHFQTQLKDDELFAEWFLPHIVVELKESGKELSKGEVFGFKELPLIGGEYEVANYVKIDVEEHFSYTGRLHEKLKDLPEGETVEISMLDLDD